MEKLKKINQILFFVMALLAITMLIIGLYTIIKEYFFSGRRNYGDSIVSNKKAENLIKKNKRSQLIDFSTINLIDSLNQIYIIPVGQKNLRKLQEIEEPQSLNMEIEELPKTEQTSHHLISSSYLYYYGYNTLNNILIYEGKDNISYPVFSYRIAILDYVVYEIKNNKYILIVACEKDINGDGKLDKDDKSNLFLYNVSKKNLVKVSKKVNLYLHRGDCLILIKLF